MPVHDWTKVDSGLFHAFHQWWIGELCDVLNKERLPPEYFALPDQNIRGPIPDVLTLRLAASGEAGETDGPVAVAARPTKTRFTKRTEAIGYLTKASRVTVRHRHGKIIAVIEIVSPGNKASTAEFRRFVEKSAALVVEGVHLLVIDLFPPGPRDPQGIAKAIWDEFLDEPFDTFPDEPLTLLAIDAGPERVLHVEPTAVGRLLPDMPLFLAPETAVSVPLEETYIATWQHFPAPMKRLLET